MFCTQKPAPPESSASRLAPNLHANRPQFKASKCASLHDIRLLLGSSSFRIVACDVEWLIVYHPTFQMRSHTGKHTSTQTHRCGIHMMPQKKAQKRTSWKIAISYGLRCCVLFAHVRNIRLGFVQEWAGAYNRFVNGYYKYIVYAQCASLLCIYIYIYDMYVALTHTEMHTQRRQRPESG